MTILQPTNKILGFFGDYRFLSNFWFAPFDISNKIYSTVEHFYQASKTINEDEHEMIRSAASPEIAKRAGRRITIKDDWDSIKDNVMLVGLTAKFTQNVELQQLLLETGSSYLEETNHWGDRYWGVCNGTGLNKLGLTLMKVRSLLVMERFFND